MGEDDGDWGFKDSIYSGDEMKREYSIVFILWEGLIDEYDFDEG